MVRRGLGACECEYECETNACANGTACAGGEHGCAVICAVALRRADVVVIKRGGNAHLQSVWHPDHCKFSSRMPAFLTQHQSTNQPTNPTHRPTPQAHPPFRIFSVSKAMPIINAQHPRNLAWTSVSFPMSLDLIPETNQVMIGYGSGDKTSRVKMMPWQEVQALFPANQHEGGGTWRYRDRRRVLKRRS